MPIPISDITNSSSTGIFDELMNAVNDHLDTQYDEERITGSDYATVYLGAMQVAMQEAIKFVVAAADMDIKESQSTQELALKQAQQDLIEQQALTEIQNTAIATQKALVAEKEVLLMDQQIAKTTAEAALLTQKQLTEVQQTLAVAAQAALYTTQMNGFKQKAAYDATKILSDMWSICLTQSTTLTDKVGDASSVKLINMIEALYNEAADPTPTYSI